LSNGGPEGENELYGRAVSEDNGLDDAIVSQPRYKKRKKVDEDLRGMQTIIHQLKTIC
jgi:hypothetical protein